MGRNEKHVFTLLKYRKIVKTVEGSFERQLYA